MQVEVTPRLRSEAAELHRRGLGSEQKFVPQAETYQAQVGLLHAYEMELTTSVIDSWMRVVPQDAVGNLVYISLFRGSLPRIYSKQAHLDRVHVVASIEDGVIDYRGWISSTQVMEAPGTDEHRDIDIECLAPMPKVFAFEEKCLHEAGTWDTNLSAWHCVCGRYIYDSFTRRVAEGSVQLVAANRKTAGGDERKAAVDRSRAQPVVCQQGRVRSDRPVVEVVCADL